MAITYRKLAELIAKMTDQQKDSQITVLSCDDEYYPAELGIEYESDVLDRNHPIITICKSQIWSSS